MSRTFVANVGHGEAIFIEMDQPPFYGVLRDFGRAKSGIHTEFSSTPKRLLNCYNHYYPYPYFSDKVDAILSHAHDDHFNGFELMYLEGWRKIFQNAYIPWLQTSDLKSLGGLLIKYSIFLSRYYSVSSIIGRNANHWLKATPIMASLSKKLWCVSAGHKIRHWGEENRILWPKPQHEASEVLVNRWESYLMKNDLPATYLDTETTEMINALSFFYGENSQQEGGTENNDDRIQTTLSTIDRILETPLSLNRQQNLTSPRTLYSFAYKPTVDNHSLIFEVGAKGSRNLFLSDANDKTTKEMLIHNKIKNFKYHLIKSGHHGNRGAIALFKAGIQSEKIVNCCGPANSNWYGPNANYLNISNDVYCTDWHQSSNKWIQKSAYKIPETCVLDFP